MSGTWNSSEKFNREALQWDEKPQRRALAFAVAQAIVKATQPAPDMRALEFGCGTGLVTLEIAPLVKFLAAVDTSTEMVAALQEKILTFGVANIETAGINLLSSSEAFADEQCFDLIYSSMTLHHIDDTAGFLNRLSTLLCPGGTMALADLDIEDGLFHDDPLENVHYGFDREALTAQLIAAGLQVTSFETIYTMEKVNRLGKKAAYPVFLVIAIKQFL
jgi:predicted TPR repeat methyltransferase